MRNLIFALLLVAPAALAQQQPPPYDCTSEPGHRDFDFWVGPEFGKAMEWGAIYAKPGWGIDTDPEDRDFTLEIGFRYFF